MLHLLVPVHYPNTTYASLCCRLRATPKARSHCTPHKGGPASLRQTAQKLKIKKNPQGVD